MTTLPLACGWTDEKRASIDWTSVDDVVDSDFTFTQLLLAHSRLREYMSAHPHERQRLHALFYAGQQRDALATALPAWHAANLLTLRQERWCCTCGAQGHTRRSCPLRHDGAATTHATTIRSSSSSSARAAAAAVSSLSSSVLDKYRAHQQRLERARLLAERHGRGTTSLSAKTPAAAAAATTAAMTGSDATASTAVTSNSNGSSNSTAATRSSTTTTTTAAAAATRKELTLFLDERRRGVVSRIDAQYGIAFVRVAEYGDVKFFVDRADFGVKQLVVGEAVTLRVDTARDYPLAVDVRPERTTVTPRDVAAFVQRCQCATQPMRVLTMLLTHVHEWQQVLRCLHASSVAPAATAPAAAATSPVLLCDAVAAVHALIALVTFVGNREPIHASVMTAFLQLTLTPVPLVASTASTSSSASSSSSCVAFFPDLVYMAVQHDAAATTTTVAAAAAQVAHGDAGDDAAAAAAHERRVHQCIEVVNYVVLLRQYTRVRDAVVAPTRRLLERLLHDEVERTAASVAASPSSSSPSLCEAGAASHGAARAARARAACSARGRQCQAALRRLCGDDALARLGALRLLPRDDEMTRPLPHPHSFFAPGNLPVVGRVTYTRVDDYIADQCTLLRADTFEAASRLLTAMCYELPDHTPTAETLADVAHASLFSHVCARGRVLTRDKDYSRPNSYLLSLRPASARASVQHGLRQGTTFCISTALDKTRVQPGELFWGVVSSSNAALLRAGVVVVTPCDEDDGGGGHADDNDGNNDNDDDNGGSNSRHHNDFDLLMEKLARNERLGRSASSLLLETTVFLTGYAAMVRALRAFIGPLAMPLPMAARLLPRALAPDTSDVATIDTTTTTMTTASARAVDTGIGLVPPHCLRAFCELTHDVRTRCMLDAGQAEVMRRLPRAAVLLVQGPPGTGKSFIGCRVVEVHTRYKQLVASGDILQKLSIEQLPSSTRNGSDLLPTLGPIVVITYKNHALDEFLVDLLNHRLWDGTGSGSAATTAANNNNNSNNGGSAAAAAASADAFPGGCRLVRIGGRSRESRLDAYNLGALLHQWSDKYTIRSLRERLYIMHQRLDRLTREVQYLESGRVPWVYFERWLTPEQRTHMPSDEREAWLAGERDVAAVASSSSSSRDAVPADLYRTLLQTNLAAALASSTRAPRTAAATTTNTTQGNNDEGNNGEGNDNDDASRAAGNTGKTKRSDDDDNDDDEDNDDEEEDEDVTRSVFQEMRREDEQREHNDALHRSYLSSEALRLVQIPPTRPARVPGDLQSLWSLDVGTRHAYYAYLIQCAIAAKARDCVTIMDAIASVVRIRNHAMDEAKLALLRGADVVGLTTTGCALNQNLLRSLRPSVLVVEEAAEVLEAQVLACMTDSLQQIVLIGDHYQLQPKVDTFVYEKHNHMNMSLFERLAAQRSEPVIRLTDQRRMHPQLSRLVRPFYAPQPLLDHASLHTRAFVTATGQRLVDRVPGLRTRVFFWRHDYPEEEAPGSRSKVNARELRMAQRLVAHLVAQGVMQKSLAVLTPYLGQARMLRSVLRLSSLADVRVSTVDLFQGDEADVVVLSLVRTAKLTEFVRMRNRLIVSCSRARFAMVLIGNDTLLRQCDHWARVLDDLHAHDAVGTRLPITRRDGGAGDGDDATPQWLDVRGSVSAAALTRDLHAELARDAMATGSAAGNDNDDDDDEEEA